MPRKDLQFYMALPYPMTVTWSAEDDLFVARAALLPGCVAHGATRQDALIALEANMEDWISVAIEDDRTVPEPPSEDQSLPSGKWLQRVPRSLHRQLIDAADEEGVSLNQLATSFLACCVGQRSPAAKDFAIDVRNTDRIRVLWSHPQMYTAPPNLTLVLPETTEQERENWQVVEPLRLANPHAAFYANPYKRGGSSYASQEASESKLFN